MAKVTLNGKGNGADAHHPLGLDRTDHYDIDDGTGIQPNGTDPTTPHPFQKAKLPVQIQSKQYPDFAIKRADRRIVADSLSALLADTYALYLRTHNFHWNIKGPQFASLHLMFETQYLELATAIDLIAERIRSLDFAAPATFIEFLELSSLKEELGVPSAERMLALLSDGHAAVIYTARLAVPLATQFHDQPTLDLLGARMAIHEKTAWMLRSLQPELNN